MTFDPTKPVQTRDGRKVELITTKGREPWVLVGYIDDGAQVVEWLKDGRRIQSQDIGMDLINVPETAEVMDFWVNVYNGNVGSAWNTKYDADRAAGRGNERKTCIHVRWTEGKGAEIVKAKETP